MWPRLSFWLVTLFWLVMNALLWRSEFGERGQRATPVPVVAVWQKMLTAPDNSSLDITHHGKKVGFCRWSPNVGEALATGKRTEEDPPIEGMVKRLAGYTLDLDGNLALENFANRVRFDLHLQLSTNHAWREFDLRLSLRPYSWQIHSRAEDANIAFRTEGDGEKAERIFKFDELANVAGLLREIPDASGLLPATVGAMGMTLNQTNAAPFSLGLQWKAFNDWLKFGQNRMRVYRLQARLLDHQHIRVFVSPVGEILRVELPDDLVLVNDAILNL